MLLAGWSTASAAQSPFTRADPGDAVLPITSYPLGESDLVAGQMMTSLRLQRRQTDLCHELGCLFIVNETKRYRVTGFHVLEQSRDGQYRWSTNQFGSPLLAHRATFRFKTGTVDCERPVMFILRGPDSREPVKIEGRANLCTTPHVHSVMRINIVRPEVIVE